MQRLYNLRQLIRQTTTTTATQKSKGASKHFFWRVSNALQLSSPQRLRLSVSSSRSEARQFSRLGYPPAVLPPPGETAAVNDGFPELTAPGVWSQIKMR
ncbi:hypothetical protein NIES4073_63390 [Kalymmatonema gypsitolerans NIES-4073]|nr:hypothetical protein NIES4073_63390 [Scytonema sp. NIES-4073]